MILISGEQQRSSDSGSQAEKDGGGDAESALAAEKAEGVYPSSPVLAVVTALFLAVFLCALDMYGSAFFMTSAAFPSAYPVADLPGNGLVQGAKVFKYFALKPGFLSAMFIFEVRSLICAVAPNSTALIVGRAFAGVGAAGLGSDAYTIVAFSAHPSKRPMLLSFIGPLVLAAGATAITDVSLADVVPGILHAY
ncbi:hypothetical protein B0T26DRAFT_753634 [Lasiosphaeria miniovina]|uniref:Major facilitator superfamily (MFS) profile domain-containing protein n=1 Tax=Lasiosphaeria miniovina TaxID=1954250 RepID=A0AA40DS56_9PEZI|nr:uncharacterized protein B0T26DRAFT_753634 [Lasiosphaeria miniovina]KAK0713540.1 hypothetical protein B0T26DRAFT_753634 [Lasiosphaeria miniovina]